MKMQLQCNGRMAQLKKANYVQFVCKEFFLSAQMEHKIIKLVAKSC